MTDSCIQVRKWVHRLMYIRKKVDRVTDWAVFVKDTGNRPNCQTRCSG